LAEFLLPALREDNCAVAIPKTATPNKKGAEAHRVLSRKYSREPQPLEVAGRKSIVLVSFDSRVKKSSLVFYRIKTDAQVLLHGNYY